MNINTFAAIDVSSFEVAMKIFEISGKGMKELDHVRHRLALGSDSYNYHKISYKKIDELCNVLNEFRDIMKSYDVVDYKIYGTSALRETDNSMIILDRIRTKTGFSIDILSNSEQRFLDYKSVASKGNEFNSILEEGTAIVGIGGGYIQISLFEDDTLVTTQNLKLGVLRVKERIDKMGLRSSQLHGVLAELIANELDVFKKMYVKEGRITNLIVVDDYIAPVINKGVIEGAKKGLLSTKDYCNFMEQLQTLREDEVIDRIDIDEADMPILRAAAYIVNQLVEILDASCIWAPGVALCDGIAYEYAEEKYRLQNHNFEKDILAAATNISKRYCGSKKRNEILADIALEIFDAMQSVHGLSPRERLLLQLSVILHDVGKFINITTVGECSYSIINNTEMIGLSHEERQMIALVARYAYEPLATYSEMNSFAQMEEQAYITVSKLTAIVRVAGTLFRGQKQKPKRITTKLNDAKLLITVSEDKGMIFEELSFKKSAAFFEEVFLVEPIVVKKTS